MRFDGCFALFPADAGSCDEVFCCRLVFLRFHGLQVVGVRGARSRPLGPDAEHLAFYTVWGDYDFRKESFYVYGVLWCGWSVGSFMVVDHEYFDINACLNSQGEFLDVTGSAGGAAGTSRCQRLGGVVRHEWRCCGAAGASSVSDFRHLGGVSVSVSVLLERRQLAVGGLRRGRPQVALSLWTATFARSLSA